MNAFGWGTACCCWSPTPDAPGVLIGAGASQCIVPVNIDVAIGAWSSGSGVNIGVRCGCSAFAHSQTNVPEADAFGVTDSWNVVVEESFG